MVVVSARQLAELDHQQNQKFLQRLTVYLQEQAPDFDGDPSTLVEKARAEGLLSERHIAMFALFAVRESLPPIDPKRCPPRAEGERVEQFRLRFDDDLSGWMAANGIEAI